MQETRGCNAEIRLFFFGFPAYSPFPRRKWKNARTLIAASVIQKWVRYRQYISFEEQINRHKAAYDEALRQSPDRWRTNENSYFPFIENFLLTLYLCYQELDKRFAIVHGKKVTKKARVEAAILNSLTPLSKTEICKILPDISPTTVEAVLGGMVKEGLIRRIGAGRATKYIRS